MSRQYFESKLDLPQREHQVYCYDTLLKDWETVEDCSITNWKSCVSSPMRTIYVPPPDGAEALALQAKSSDYIDDVLVRIPPEVAGSLKGQPCLFLDGIGLTCDKSLTQYGIPSGSRLCLDRLVQINVTGPSGSNTTVDVNPCYKIKAVKERIEEICGIPSGIQSLTYGDNDITIGHYEAILGSHWALRWKFCHNSWSFFWPSYKALHS